MVDNGRLSGGTEIRYPELVSRKGGSRSGMGTASLTRYETRCITGPFSEFPEVGVQKQRTPNEEPLLSALKSIGGTVRLFFAQLRKNGPLFSRV
ncbi:MAG: hypothetical protein H5T72_06255 [Actinobacteria bacterium]|nr:hypothetical protein [Actinomycetota bacterium]